MGIKIKHRDPKSTDFSPNDIIINVKEGTIFYKSNEGLFRIQGDNLNTPNVTELVLDNIIKGNLSVSGSIIPEGSGSFDLGSESNPWKDLHVTSESIKFYDSQGEIGRLTFERDKGVKIKNQAGAFGIISSSFITATTALKSPSISFDSLTGSINGGSF